METKKLDANDFAIQLKGAFVTLMVFNFLMVGLMTYLCMSNFAQHNYIWSVVDLFVSYLCFGNSLRYNELRKQVGQIAFSIKE